MKYREISIEELKANWMGDPPACGFENFIKINGQPLEAMNFDIQINTDRTGQMLLQTVTGPSFNPVTNAREILYRQCVDLADAQVRSQLIAMGWTPPKDAG